MLTNPTLAEWWESQIERGDYSPSVTLALKIAKACGANVEDIFSYEEEERG